MCDALCQTQPRPFWLLLCLTVKRGQISQTFHILNSNSPSVSLSLSLLQVDVSSPGAPRVAFKPDCRQLATSVGLLSESIRRLRLIETSEQSFHRRVCQRSSRAGLCAAPEPGCLGKTASPWTRSPPTLVIPTTLDAPGDHTGMGTSCSVYSYVSSCLCFHLQRCTSLQVQPHFPFLGNISSHLPK